MGEKIMDIPRVLGPDDGLLTGVENGSDRFMVDSVITDGRVAVVEQVIPVGMLAAPMHIHSREDEYSYILEGRIGAIFDDQEVYAEQGDLLYKPRGEWHTFWNAGEEPLRLLEIITPGGLEELFKQFGTTIEKYGPEALPALAAEFGCELDFQRTSAIAERHNLKV